MTIDEATLHRLREVLRDTLDALSQVRDCHDCIRIWGDGATAWEKGLWVECEALLGLLTEEAA